MDCKTVHMGPKPIHADGKLIGMSPKKIDTIVVAILDNETESDAPTLPAKIAWKIDEKNAKFVKPLHRRTSLSARRYQYLGWWPLAREARVNG